MDTTMGLLHAHLYLADRSLAAPFVGPAIDTRMLKNKRVSFTAWWPAVALTDGDFYLEATDDPRAGLDALNRTATATWIKRTIPDGATDGDGISVAGKAITIDASAGAFNLCVTDMPTYIRVGYTWRAGGGVAQIAASGG